MSRKPFRLTKKTARCCAICILCVFSLNLYAQDLSTEATSVLLAQVKDLLKEDNPEALLPYLREVLVRMEDGEDEEMREARSFCMYQIGICQMQLSQYADAVGAFEAFIEEFPKDSLAPRASLLIAEAHAMGGDWAAVEKYAQSLLGDKALDSEQRLTVRKLLSGALFHQQKWQEATTPLLEILKSAEESKVRSQAAVMLATCYAKQNDFEKLTKFIPLGGELAQQSGGLNIALLEAADKKNKAGDYKNALYLYRMVLMKDELIVRYQKQMAEMELFLAKPFVPGVGRTRSAYDKVHRTKQMEYNDRKAGLEKIQKAPAYDMDISLRIAQCYVGLKRNVPAYTLYQKMIADSPEHPLAEDARYNSFSVMVDMQNWDGAMKEGAAYMSQYPQGKFVDETSINLMQIYLQNGRVADAKALGTSVIESRPDHRFIDQVKYLLGYIYFQSLDYPEALALFTEIPEKWPESIRVEACDYWIAMCHLFMGRYDLAAADFEAYLNNPDYPEKRFAEDASYRLGIAQYGLGDFEKSEKTFLRFINVYPDSDLESEAYSMLGDLRGAEGDLEMALKFYAQGYKVAVNVAQINYALFQSAAVYELEERYDEIISMMESYLADWGEESNFAGAAFWIGKAYKATDRYVEALATYIEAVVEFGNTLENNDVDLILRELINEQQSEEGVLHRAALIQRMNQELRRAKQQGENTLALRLETLLAYTTEGAQREKHIQVILSKENVEVAGPLTLLLVAKEALARKNYQLVHETYDHCVAAFEESEILLDVMNLELQTRLDEKDFEGVLALAEEITNRFGYQKEVGITRKLKADAHRLAKQYPEAIKTYTELFAVREWRGPLTPEALYWIGYCKNELGETEEAFAFFQRVYVLYEGYADWAAKAYEASVSCLQKLGGREEDIVRTVQEMLANEKIAATPEGKRARVLLNQLRPAGGAQ